MAPPRCGTDLQTLLPWHHRGAARIREHLFQLLCCCHPKVVQANTNPNPKFTDEERPTVPCPNRC
jgi:hypothetical protein